MAINFNSFTEGTTSNIQSNDYVVGFDNTSPGGERKWTVSTIANAVLSANSVGATQIANGSVTAAKLGTNEQKQICKAWVNFNGTTSPGTIRSSYNVSSVTKNGTGDYTVNFATALADANYSVCGTGSSVSSGETSGRLTVNPVPTTPLTTNSARIPYVGAAYYDPLWASVQIFGN
jgi:hypothetical protein